MRQNEKRSAETSECCCITRALPSAIALALQRALHNGLSLECLLTASWSQILGCYSAPDFANIPIWLYRPSRDRQGVEPPCDSILQLLEVPAAPETTIDNWLLALSQSIAVEPEVPLSSLHLWTPPPSRNAIAGLPHIVSTAPHPESTALAAQLGNLLVLSLAPEPDFSFGLSYASARFPAAFIALLLDCLQHVFEQLLTQPTLRLRDLSLVPPPTQLSPIPSDFPGFVHDQIAAVSRRDPDRIAATFDNSQLTFRDLDELSNRLAHYLLTLGCGPESIVAVHLGRSLDTLVSILAILKAGAAFLPLDAALPWKRVETVLHDSSAHIVITSLNLASRFNGSPIQSLAVDDPAHPWRNQSPTPFVSAVRQNSLAYVIYTSGSTGTPKGVMIEHRNLAAFLLALDRWMGAAPGVWLAMSSISFDISIIELLWTLSRGFHVVLHRGDGGLPVFSGPASIPEQIAQYGVTHLMGTPTLMRILIGEPAGAPALARLQYCAVGGEAFPQSLASILLEHLPGRLYNAYGPTEITVCATQTQVIDAARPIPIGAPLANSRLYVVDRWNRLLPPLAPGELLIGGPSVGRGYLGKPELTAQRFIPNPFDPRDPYRLYRSGDLVRANLEGELEFLDRLDSQVKIRGYRIELGEIESALCRHPLVQQAVLLAIPDPNGEKKLAGFYTTSHGSPVDRAELRKHLCELLPPYMVPSALRHAARLPLLPTGKIDRSALAQRAQSEQLQIADPPNVQTETDSAQPLDPAAQAMEQAICSWCSDLLKIPSVRPSDDFFELGVESLAAARLVRRIAEVYAIQIPLSALLNARTVRALVLLVQAGNAAPAASPVVPFRTQGSNPPLFFIAGLGGNVLNFEFVSQKMADRPIYGVEARGLNQHAEVLSTVEEMARTYLAEIRAIQPHGPYFLVGYSFGGILAFEMAQQFQALGETVGLLGLLDTAEWQYTRQQLSNLSLRRRFAFKYGATLKQIVFGPSRRKVLAKRLQAALEHRKLAALHGAGQQAHASAASVEHRNYFALTQYSPRPYSGALQLFRCHDASPLRGSDPTLGWARLCSQVTIASIEGDHENLTAQRFAPSLAKRLEQALHSYSQSAPSRRDAA